MNQDRRQSLLHPLVRRDDSLQLALQLGEGLSKEKLPFPRVAPAKLIQAGRALCALGASDDQRQFGRIERFDQVIERPQSHGLHRASDAAFGGHDHHTGAGWKDLFLQQVCAASVRQIDVEQHEIKVQLSDEPFGGLHRIRPRHVSAQFVQVSADLFSEQGFVLHDQNAQTGQRHVLHIVLVVGQTEALWRH